MSDCETHNGENESMVQEVVERGSIYIGVVKKDS